MTGSSRLRARIRAIAARSRRLLGVGRASASTGSRRPRRSRTSASTLDDFRIRWYADGELNASVNCLDRHLATRGDKTALIFEPDDPAQPPQRITYRELHARVCRLANALRNLGVRKGDRVTIYLPMIPEAVGRDARLRAHRRDPLGGVRRLRAALDRRPRRRLRAASWSSPPTKACAAARRSPLKANVDAALKLPGTNSRRNRAGRAPHRRRGRRCRCRATAGTTRSSTASRDTCEPERMNAEDPLFILYTSGSHRQAQGRAAHHRRLPGLRQLHPRVACSTCARTTSTGAPPTSAGSPATATSSTGRWPTARPR